MTKKLCIVCGVGPREVPDRNSGSNVKRVCRSCHQQRLVGDLREIMKQREKRNG